MTINISKLRQNLKSFDFKRLFIEELGWDRYNARPLVIVVGTIKYTLTPIVEKRGFQVFACSPNERGEIPDHLTRVAIYRQVEKSALEHLLIFIDAKKTTQQWQWVRREPGKPLAVRTASYRLGQAGDSLIQRLTRLAVDFSEEERVALVDVNRRVRAGFDLERVTTRFYERFKDEHAALLLFLKTIPDLGIQQWYASVILNRMMFIYFIQKKGFLDGDNDYLRHKLEQSQASNQDRFYRDVLCPLFFEGFAKKEYERSADINKLLGKVPYLNGGLFARHQIEECYGEVIQIADAAFERLFRFFEQYQWNLDERPLRDDREINPDVLGFIFEKYINKKQMGAYYTKEDITEYISKNTVLPFLFNRAQAECRIAFDGEQSVWRLLRADPDRYIYPTVRHGAELRLPDEIVAGLDDMTKRASWNRPAPTEYALPTELWREVVMRRKRYEEVRTKLATGGVRDINGLITYNLDIRQFAQDVIATCEGPELLRAFYKAIEYVTVLDPTCGSGAFLFAALNILEPLYEACLDRMQEFLVDFERSAEKIRPEKFSDFRKTLERVAQHPNRRYFVLKSIIVNNLYGVDIMEEATEICKLRLFLKLVAQIDRTENIEPLPDIDFNIRAGNALVGFATRNEVRKAITTALDGQMRLMTDDRVETLERIEEKAEAVDRLFSLFRQQQTELGGDVTVTDKHMLQMRLNTLAEELNRHLASEYGVDITQKVAYEKWLKSHQPFHWFIDFYGIMNRGGFDVIIGNPPYAEVPKELSRPLLRDSFKTALSDWSRDEDLYTFVVERSISLLDMENSKLGMIVPISIAFSTKKPYVSLRKFVMQQSGNWWFSHFDRIPSALFGNEVRTRCTIALFSKSTEAWFPSTTSLMRWEAEERQFLFEDIIYSNIQLDISNGLPKVGSQIQANTLQFLFSKKRMLSEDLVNSISFSTLVGLAPRFPQSCVYVGGTAYNWFPAWRDVPETTTINGLPSLPARTAGYKFKDEQSANIVFALLCSSMGYWWWAVSSDGFNLKKWLTDRFPLALSSLSPDAKKEIATLGRELRVELKKQYVYKDNKGRIGNFYLPACQDKVQQIDSAIERYVEGLSHEFFEDIRVFNQRFSRVDVQESDRIDEE